MTYSIFSMPEGIDVYKRQILYYAQAKNAFLTDAWIWWILPPGIMIILLVFGLMMIAYGMEGRANQRLEEKNG